MDNARTDPPEPPIVTPPAPSRRPRLAEALAAYGRLWREEAVETAAFIELAEDPADPFVRERAAGHFTASAWLVSADGRRTLLVHHRKLDRWLQPGGHADGDPDLAGVALREAQEETGVAGLRVEPGIFDLDRHRIPEHGGVPAHWHYDVRYAVRAGADERYTVSAESLALAWRGIDELACDGDADPSLRRMARKWLARASAP